MEYIFILNTRVMLEVTYLKILSGVRVNNEGLFCNVTSEGSVFSSKPYLKILCLERNEESELWHKARFLFVHISTVQ